MKSNFLNLNIKDVAKSILMVVLTALVGGIYQLLEAGAVLDWVTIKPVLTASVLAGVSYLLKNFLTNSEDKILTPDK